MTSAQLHQIDNFSALFSDPRLTAALTYLRHSHPDSHKTDAGHWQGWFSALDALERLATAPKPEISTPKKPLYSGGETETNQPTQK